MALTRSRLPRRLQAAFLCFLFYSVLGWAYEVILEVFIYQWGYSDRGVLTGPYCPVYGFGALLFLAFFYRLVRGKPWRTKLLRLPAIFLATALTATLVELGASYVCEALTGSWPWQTYADYTYNFQARIALSPSIRFGLGGVLFLYGIQPLLDRILRALPQRALDRTVWVLGTLFTVDLVHFLIQTL